LTKRMGRLQVEAVDFNAEARRTDAEILRESDVRLQCRTIVVQVTIESVGRRKRRDRSVRTRLYRTS